MYEIVGVTPDIRWNVERPAMPMYFLPEAQATHFNEGASEVREVWSHYLYNIVIWTAGDSRRLDARVRMALADLDPDLVMYDLQPYSEVIRANLSGQNMVATLTWLFAMIGLILAAVGLYGVTAYGVEQRTSEIGVRMALGADRGSVAFMVLRGAFLQVAIGLALGVPAAIGAGHLIANWLFDVTPWDPLMLSTAALLLGLTALAAALIPARRASTLDPVRALRLE